MSDTKKVRKNFVICMIGANGTGKTSVTKEIIWAWKRGHPDGKTIICDVHQQLVDETDFNIKINPNWAMTIDSKIRNSLVVLDDYKLLVDGYTPTDGMRDLFINRRHHNNDYIYSCHSPADVLQQIIPFTTHFYIFYTKALQGKFKERLPFSDLLITASSYVNKYVSLWGTGKHKLDPEYAGQDFPYFIVEPDAPENLRMRGMNMKKRVIIG